MRKDPAREAVQELVEDLRRHAASARELLSKVPVNDSDIDVRQHVRLQSKASTYDHAAELVSDAIVRLLGPAEKEAARGSRGAYVASRASIPARGKMWRDIRERGGLITSTWIDEDGPGQTASMAELWARIAEEVCSSSHLVLYVERDDLPLKGALVEVGMALAVGLEVRVVDRGFTVTDDIGKLLGSWVTHPNVVFISDEMVAVCHPPTNGKGSDLELR